MEGCSELEPIPADTEREVHLDRSPVHYRANTQKQTLIFTPTGNSETPINLHVFGLWEEAAAPTQPHQERPQNGQRR